MILQEKQVEELARGLFGAITRFYEDEKNEEEFQKWKQEKLSGS